MQALKSLFVQAGRKSVVLATGAGSMIAAGASQAADDMSSGAVAAITAAQTSGTTVGASVIACVAGLCVVGIVIALVRKV